MRKNILLISGMIMLVLLLISFVNAQAQCVPNFKDVKVIVNDSFGIGQNIIASVLVNPSIGSYANIPVRASLYDSNGNIISGTTLTNPITDSFGKATLNFNYASSKIQDINISVIVGNPAGVNYKTSAVVHVLATLGVQLNCPAIGYVGRDVACSWVIMDLDTNTQQTFPPTITITQGNTNINTIDRTSVGLKYNTNCVSTSCGNVITTVTASKTGYISASQTSPTTIKPLTRIQYLLIDGKDSSTYSQGISTGTHSLEIKVDEIGVPADVQEVDATMLPPGQTTSIPLSFTKISTGDFKANYNFLATGQGYVLDGTIIFTDPTKISIPLSPAGAVSLSTIGSGPCTGSNCAQCKILFFISSSATSDLCGQYNMLAWGAFIGLIVVIVTIVIIVRVTRRK